MKTLLLLLSATVLLTAGASANAGAGPWANGAYFPGQLDGRYSANVYNNTQARFDTDQMDTPSGNRVRTDTFTTNTSFATNITSVTVVTNIGGLAVTNVVTRTNISSVGTTNLVTPGSAAVVSGVLGFGVRNGTPSTGTDASAQTATGANASTAVRSISLDTSHNYFVIYVDGDVFAGQTAAGINLNTKRVAGSLWAGVGRSQYELVETPILNTNGAIIGFDTKILNLPGAEAGGYFNAKIKSDKSPFVFKGSGEISTRGTPQGNRGNATYPFDLDGIKSSGNSISGYSRDAP